MEIPLQASNDEARSDVPDSRETLASMGALIAPSGAETDPVGVSQALAGAFDRQSRRATNGLIDPENLRPLIKYDKRAYTTRISLHSHSDLSDGEFSPEDLARRFLAAGVAEAALTDHDNLDGQERFVKACLKLGINAHPGVELTGGSGIHIVLLDMDIYNPTLIALIERTKLWRMRRAQAIISGLNGMPELKDKGVVITLEEVLAKTTNGEIERPHIARVLVDKGIVKKTNEAWAKFLKSEIKTPEVSALEPKPEEVMRAAHDSGGVAFLAHHHTVAAGMSGVIELLRTGMHIEAYKRRNGATREERLKRKDRLVESLLLAHDMNLLVLPGPDYHGPSTYDSKMTVGMPHTLAEQLLKALEEPNKRALAKIAEKALRIPDFSP